MGSRGLDLHLRLKTTDFEYEIAEFRAYGIIIKNGIYEVLNVPNKTCICFINCKKLSPNQVSEVSKHSKIIYKTKK